VTGIVVLPRVRRALLFVGLVLAAMPVGSALANPIPDPRTTHLRAGFAPYRNLTPSQIEAAINALDPRHPVYP